MRRCDWLFLWLYSLVVGGLNFVFLGQLAPICGLALALWICAWMEEHRYSRPATPCYSLSAYRLFQQQLRYGGWLHGLR